VALLNIDTPRVFLPLLEPAPYKGARGGRGSGKSHFFAEYSVEEAVRFPGDCGEGLRMVCIREVQKDLSQSSKLIIEDKIAKSRLGVADGFKIWKDRIETPKDGIIIFKGMNDYTAESSKSLERFKRAWIDEAQSLSARSLSLLRPTVHRWPGSEIWASWNTTRKVDAIDDFFCGPGGLPKGALFVKANWRDNPFWNESAEAERQLELEKYPERYDHTYEGGYAKAFEGAYFAKLLTDAKLKGRIGKVSADPLLPIRAFHDLGGASANADAYTIWIVQWVGQEIRILDYYESVGQVLGFHVAWMRKHGYQDAINYLPHDGARADGIIGKRYADHWRDASFTVEPPVPNQGPGAASIRIEAMRRLGPKMWWNEVTTEDGRTAIGFYHERKDDKRSVGLGPEHDWSSHAADALGMMCCCYEEPGRAEGFGRKLVYADQGYC
jgi:phage terminase large subunit